MDPDNSICSDNQIIHVCTRNRIIQFVHISTCSNPFSCKILPPGKDHYNVLSMNSVTVEVSLGLIESCSQDTESFFLLEAENVHGQQFIFVYIKT